MEGCQLKYIVKLQKHQKEKVLANTLLLLLVKGGFFKIEDHVFNLLFLKQPEKHDMSIAFYCSHSTHMMLTSCLHQLLLSVGAVGLAPNKT